MELKDEFYKVAMGYYNSEEAAVACTEAFMEKIASQGQLFGGQTSALIRSNLPHFNEAVAKGLGMLAVGVAGAGIAKAVLSGSQAVSQVSLRQKYETALATVMASHRIVKTADSGKVKSYGETIFKFAPHVAGDPNLLASLLANVIQGEGIDPMTIKTLVELEEKYSKSNQPGNIPHF